MEGVYIHYSFAVVFYYKRYHTIPQYNKSLEYPDHELDSCDSNEDDNEAYWYHIYRVHVIS